MSSVDEAVLTEDGVRLWATRAGEGAPVVLCHGGPDVAGLLADRATVHRWEALDGRKRTEAEDREWCVLQCSADYADRERALERAEAAGTPWFGVNFECDATINAEVNRTSGTPELRAARERLDVPVLIVHGAEDIRPNWALDSLERALPRVSRTVLDGAGHLPWVEEPNGFRSVVGDFLAAR